MPAKAAGRDQRMPGLCVRTGLTADAAGVGCGRARERPDREGMEDDRRRPRERRAGLGWDGVPGRSPWRPTRGAGLPKDVLTLRGTARLSSRDSCHFHQPVTIGRGCPVHTVVAVERLFRATPMTR
jgi:hypothetical protein